MSIKKNIKLMGDEARVGLAVAYAAAPKFGQDKSNITTSFWFSMGMYAITIYLGISGHMGWSIIPFVVGNLSLLGYFMQREYRRVYDAKNTTKRN